MVITTYQNNFFNRRTLVTLGILFALCFVFCFSGIAHASETGTLPWNTGLEKLVNAFSGKTALFVSAIGLFALMGLAMFGGDLGSIGKSLLILVFSGCVLGGLMAVVNVFVSSSGCLI